MYCSVEEIRYRHKINYPMKKCCLRPKRSRIDHTGYGDSKAEEKRRDREIVRGVTEVLNETMTSFSLYQILTDLISKYSHIGDEVLNAMNAKGGKETQFNPQNPLSLLSLHAV